MIGLSTLNLKAGGRGVFVTLGVITMISWKLGLIGRWSDLFINLHPLNNWH